MSETNYRVSVYLMPQRLEVELSHDRIHEGSRTVEVDNPVDGARLIAAVRERIATYPGEQNGIQYTIAVRRTLGSVSDGFESVFHAESINVPDTIYAEDLRAFIAEILGVESA